MFPIETEGCVQNLGKSHRLRCECIAVVHLYLRSPSIVAVGDVIQGMDSVYSQTESPNPCGRGDLAPTTLIDSPPLI